MDKFNAFSKAQDEIDSTHKESVAKPRRERKEQMSIVLTPTHKEKIRVLANKDGISVSELIGDWIDNN